MGLLDDAIREHLDLKRARGGDPAEIERMEREALGPVRREPTIGSARVDTVDEVVPHAFDEPEFHEEQLTELEELQELGYNDSTAPHLHPHHEHGHDVHPEHDLDFEHAQLEQPEPEAEEVEQPKRRFLRRNRPASLSEPAASDSGFHEELPVEHDDLYEHPDALAHDEPGLAPPPASPPPHLQFEHPPKRPRFTAEPPMPEPETSRAPRRLTPSHWMQPRRPRPRPPSRARRHILPRSTSTSTSPRFGTRGSEQEPQETTEFDVQRHLAEAHPEQEEDVLAETHPEQEEDMLEETHPEQDEDVLEETPEFLQDTPEHDRLWFEQRPPKDFDFNG